VATKDRPVDLGTALARGLVDRAGRELRAARQDRGLSLRVVARSCGLSESQVSRIERGLVATVSVRHLARLHAVVGLELSMRSYPGGSPIRDHAHLALLEDFRSRLDPAISWSTEVPLPGPGDRRAWDGMVRRTDWRYGVEAETAPRDAQALIRRLQLKVRDGDVDGVILVVRSTAAVREFLEVATATLQPSFPIDGPKALARLSRGDDPGGSAIVILPRRRR
jgi:transcriptional regulator with XRE-family HTH domain